MTKSEAKKAYLFLKRNKCLNNFIDNLLKSRWREPLKVINRLDLKDACKTKKLVVYLLNIETSRFIRDSFAWQYSEEGDTYWRKIYYKWRKHIDNIE